MNTLWWLATEVIVKIKRVESIDWLGNIVGGFRRIQSETRVRQNMGRTHWSLATEDGENPRAMIQSDDVQGKIVS